MPIKGKSRFSKKDAFPDVVDQRDPVLLFESMDSHADARLAHHELFGSPRNTLLLGNLTEHAQVPMLVIGSIGLHRYPLGCRSAPSPLTSRKAGPGRRAVL